MKKLILNIVFWVPFFGIFVALHLENRTGTIEKLLVNAMHHAYCMIIIIGYIFF